MAKLISFLTFLVSFGILAADPTETPCLDEVQFDKNMVRNI